MFDYAGILNHYRIDLNDIDCLFLEKTKLDSIQFSSRDSILLRFYLCLWHEKTKIKTFHISTIDPNNFQANNFYHNLGFLSERDRTEFRNWWDKLDIFSLFLGSGFGNIPTGTKEYSIVNIDRSKITVPFGSNEGVQQFDIDQTFFDAYLWLELNCIDKFYYAGGYFFFENKEDAIRFKLKY